MHKKTIGIITIQKPPENYGASLQCYALWRYITSLGFNCEVIDLLRPWSKEYIRSHKDKPSKHTSFHLYIRRSVSSFFLKKETKFTDKEHDRRFKEFNNLLKYSKRYRGIDELYLNPPQYDIYISGSDQIWNPNMPYINEPYFLTFAPTGRKKISYASSFAVESLPDHIKPDYAKWLKDYEYITVREESGCNIVYELLNKNVSVALDSAFLLSTEEWARIAVNNKHCRPYIFVYSLQYNEQLIKYAKQIATRKNWDIVLILSAQKKNEEKNIIQITDSGPKEWLGWIMHAELVLTNSFHGTIFSMLYGVNFFTHKDQQSKVFDRIMSLLKMFSLETHIIENEPDDIKINKMHTIIFDYEEFARELKEKRSQSCNYLNNTIYSIFKEKIST